MISTWLARSASRLAAALLTGVLLSVLALPAAARTMFYVPVSFGQTGSWYVVFGSGGKARLVGQAGNRQGNYTDSGTEQVVTLGSALSYEYLSAPNDVDCNGKRYQKRYDLKQIIFRRGASVSANKGKSSVVEIGTIVHVGGCTPGATEPVGSVSDPGYEMHHRATNSRTPMTDVVAGFTMAGFREGAAPDAYLNPYAQIAADGLTLDDATTARFTGTDTTVAASLDAEQWLVLQMPGFQRGYTRILLNSASGTETWMEAEFSGGKPQRVTNVLMVKPMPGATFGTKSEASRMWESMIGLGTNNPFFFHLYGNWTGETVSKDIAAASAFRVPLTWRFDGGDVVTSRGVGSNGSTLAERRWLPLARTGKYIVVMEQEVRTPPASAAFVYIPWRVIFYLDRGKATPPP